MLDIQMLPQPSPFLFKWNFAEETPAGSLIVAWPKNLQLSQTSHCPLMVGPLVSGGGASVVATGGGCCFHRTAA